ncbi:DUF433 domain-containing protein [Scytonema millei]|uniref:DUF433 domain-containing protein n=1 Tax=Scytonema millei TaxID=1245922 RepID=UPI000A45C48D
MTLAIEAELAPLETNADSVVLVGKTRVTLDTVVAVFKQGATAEEIVYRYPSLKRADVNATIAFYLNHQQEVEVMSLKCAPKLKKAIVARLWRSISKSEILKSIRAKSLLAIALKRVIQMLKFGLFALALDTFVDSADVLRELHD